MADFECQQLEIGLEFVHCSFAERNNFSKGSYEPKKDTQVIQVWGWQPHVFFNSNYFVICLFTFRLPVFNTCPIYIYVYNVFLRITATMNLYYNLYCTKYRWQISNADNYMEIGLEFVCWSFTERNNFSDGSSEPSLKPNIII